MADKDKENEITVESGVVGKRHVLKKLQPEMTPDELSAFKTNEDIDYVIKFFTDEVKENKEKKVEEKVTKNSRGSKTDGSKKKNQSSPKPSGYRHEQLFRANQAPTEDYMIRGKTNEEKSKGTVIRIAEYPGDIEGSLI